jgi:hypothetical protein
MRELLYAQLLSRALCVFAKLGIADLLAQAPKAVDELARAAAADVVSLRRLLRGLAVFEIVTEPAPDTFALTELGAALRADADASALPTALLLADEVGTAWAELADTVRTGQSSFETTFGAKLFDYLETKPDRREVFDRSQAHGLHLELDEIMAHVDFPDTGLIVDLGGGDGAFLLRVLAERPGALGVVVDLPGTVPLARRRIAVSGLSDRCRAEAGDFFTSIPEDGDCYVLSHILHDWNDDDALTVLRTCRRHLAPTAELLVIDLFAADHATADPGYRTTALMDLYMLSLFGGDGGRERGASEFDDLLTRAGFHVDRTCRMPSGMGVLHARPTT